MTTKAKPKFYFNNIKFNSSYYDTEIDDNIPRPINQSTSTLNSVLTLTNLSPIQTSWTVPASVITNYVNFNTVAETLISNISGTPTTINTLVLPSIGASINSKFALPTTSGLTGAVLTLGASNLTNWTIPTQIINYVNYNNLNSNLISNVSGTPSIINSISMSGLLTCIGISNSGTLSSTNTTITGTIGVSGLSTLTGGVNAVSALIQTTGEIKGRLLTIQNNTPTTTATISNAGLLTCIGISNSGTLSSTNTTITGTIGVSGLSSLNGGITTNNNTINSGTGSISGGALSCTTLTSSTLNGLTCQGLIVKNGTTTNASLSNLGVLTCKAIQNNGNTLGCGNITCGSIDTINNEIDCGTGTVFAGIFSASGDSVLNSGTSSSKISIGSNQGSGSIDIGMNGGRSGDINIGYPTVSGSINIGRPIRMPGLVYTNSSEIGYSQNTTVTYSTSTGNGTESGIRKITTLPVLINNANYLINYSLQIDPLANFNATKLQFGIYRTTIFTDPIPNLSQNLHMLSGSTGANSTRYITAELYCYSGSGFLKYNSISTYSFSHILTFTGTVPTIIVNIDIIRIS